MINLMKLNIILIILTNSTFAVAEEQILSKEQATKLFKNKTFDGTQVIKGKTFRVYSSADGDHKIYYANGKVKTRYWQINQQGEHCIAKKPDKKGRCSQVKSVGGGVYHKITKGKHTHTLQNFQEGNQIKQ